MERGRDDRLPPFLWVGNEVMELLMERSDQSVAWLYLTLAYLASQARDATHRGFECSKLMLCDRSGMTKRTINAKLEVLVEMGLLEVERQTTMGGRDQASIYVLKNLGVPSSTPREHHQVAPPNARASREPEERKEESAEDSALSLDVDDERFHKFVKAHADEVEKMGMRRPRHSKAGDAAARRILAREPDARVIMAALRYGLGSPSSWMRGKVKTLVGFDQVWDETVSGARIERDRGAGGRRGEADYVQPSTRATDYANDQV